MLPSAQAANSNVNALPSGAPVGLGGSALHAPTLTSHAGSSNRPNLLPDLNELPPEAKSTMSGGTIFPHIPKANSSKRRPGRPLGSRDKDPIAAHERRVEAWNRSRPFRVKRPSGTQPGSQDHDPEGSHLGSRKPMASRYKNPQERSARLSATTRASWDRRREQGTTAMKRPPDKDPQKAFVNRSAAAAAREERKRAAKMRLRHTEMESAGTGDHGSSSRRQESSNLQGGPASRALLRRGEGLLGGSGGAFQPFQRNHMPPSAPAGNANGNALPSGAPVRSVGSASHASTSTSHVGSPTRPNLLPDLNEVPPEVHSPTSQGTLPHATEANPPQRGRGRPLGSRDKDPIVSREKRVLNHGRKGKPLGHRDSDEVRKRKSDGMKEFYQRHFEATGTRYPSERRQRQSDAMQARIRRRIEAAQKAAAGAGPSHQSEANRAP